MAWEGSRLAFCPPGIGPRRHLSSSRSSSNPLPAPSLRLGGLFVTNSGSAQNRGDHSPSDTAVGSAHGFYPDPTLFMEVEAEVVRDLRPDLFLSLPPEEEMQGTLWAPPIPALPTGSNLQQVLPSRRRRRGRKPVGRSFTRSVRPTGESVPRPSVATSCPVDRSPVLPRAEQPTAPPGGARDAEDLALEDQLRAFAPIIKDLREALFCQYSEELEAKLKEVEGHYRAALQGFYSGLNPVPKGPADAPAPAPVPEDPPPTSAPVPASGSYKAALSAQPAQDAATPEGPQPAQDAATPEALTPSSLA
ncbi:translation initiation factor IF-2-like [Fundulus heteroclitus]|uniref:translation initiation factor IF-2-like n=1 Tax=Fundulus heteroclitus TaxID=8078 RepID=UPI00165A5640|nr:translation initiation factor IF-2-like [Fundulus heteroclitus]